MKKTPKSICGSYKHAYTCTYMNVYMFTHIHTERFLVFNHPVMSFVSPVVVLFITQSYWCITFRRRK